MEFGQYLRRREEEQGVSGTIRAARAAAPASSPLNHLKIVSGPKTVHPRQSVELPESPVPPASGPETSLD
jgi:hypothetical protein